MKILQLIYTSCKKGLSSGAGFQTYSMSEGINEEERREIERYGLYVPPTDLPTQPTKEEIETLFPVALRFFRLKSGRFGICQSTYSGQDYSGRYGNYFCHALVLDSGCFPVYPIRLYKSPVFRDHLTEAEIQAGSTPRPLPVLDLAEVAASLPIRFDDVLEFIKNRGIEPVKEMITAAISYHETHRSLVLSDSQTNIFYWIAAIQMAFPIELAHNLTFATYIHDPTCVNIKISGVPKTGSRFAFSEIQRNFEHYIFDFENPGVPVCDKEYEITKNIDLGYTISQESLKEFHQFINLFDFNFINKELDGIGYLFRISKVGLEDLSSEKVFAAVEFANRYAPKEILGQLADNLLQNLESLSSQVDFKSAEIMSKFLFNISRQSAEKRHLETAYRFFFQSLDHLVIHPPQPDLEATENFYGSIRDENKAYLEEFTGRVLSKHRLEQILQYIANNRDALRAEIYFNLAAGAVISAGLSWDYMMKNHPLFKSFIQYSFVSLVCVEKNLRGALQSAAKDKDFFVEFISFCLSHLIATEENRQILLNNYIKIMENKTTDSAVSIRLALIRHEHSQFIYEEFFKLLQNASNKPEFFWSYFNLIFKKDAAFLKERFSTAVGDLLEHLWDKDQFKECGKIIDYEEYITSREVLQQVVQGFEKGLELSSPDEAGRRKILEVLAIKKKQKIVTSPDVSRLILLGIEAEKAVLNPGQLRISDLIKAGSNTFSLQDLDLARVKKYVSWSLINLLRLVSSYKDHAALVGWLGNSKLDKSFILEYISGIKKIMKEDKKTGSDILLSFLKFYLSTLFNNEKYWHVQEKTHRDLVKILIKLSKSRFDDIRSRIVKSSHAQEGAAKREWMNILEDVSQKRNRSLFSGLKRFFHKKNEHEKDISKQNKKKRR